MEKIRIEDLKYEDFIKEDNIYGVVFLIREEKNNLFKKIEDKSDCLRLTLSELDNTYSDYKILKVNSVKELQQYVDKLSNNPDSLLYAEAYYGKESFKDKEDLRIRKISNIQKKIIKALNMDTSLNFLSSITVMIFASQM